MIFSLDEYGPTTTLETSICIVGAGAAGIAVAIEFDRSGHDVLLVEAGGLHLDEATTNDIYRGFANDPHPNPSEFREVVFGGTAKVWGGRCVPYDPLDFEHRDHVPGVGWPISYQDVADYYPRALTYCDAGQFDFSLAGSIANPAPTVPGLEDFSVVRGDRIERYSLPTDFGKKYRKQIARSLNITALLNARCVSINRGPGKRYVESIAVVDRSSVNRLIRAKTFILAMGGIEIPRLLLSSDPDGPGLGNESDHVGRYYTSHFENFAGRLTGPPGQPIPFGFEKTIDGVYCRRKLHFSPDAQSRHRLLNTAFRLHFPAYSDAAHRSAVGSAIFLGKATIPTEYRAILQHGGEDSTVSPISKHVRNVVMGLPELGGFALQWTFRHYLARRKLPYVLFPNPDGSYPIEFDSEQTPLASSRVSLTREVDSVGMRRVDLNWQINPDDLEATQRAFRLLRDVLSQNSQCRFEFDDESLAQAVSESIPGGGHHIGTTRMASSACDGVVDRDCAVFGLSNLYVASSSVFPTSSHANPTLTIVALALRLADHLKDKLR